MESLTTFFILEGLFFQAIGSILVVSGIFNIRIDLRKRTRNSFNEFNENTKNMNAIMDKLIQKTNNNTITIEDKITALFKITQYITKSQKTTGYLLSDTQTSQTKKSQLRGQQGLYFLLGGLLLQGIGVINQLQ